MSLRVGAHILRRHQPSIMTKWWAPTQASIPIRHGGILASRASTWPRDHFKIDDDDFAITDHATRQRKLKDDLATKSLGKTFDWQPSICDTTWHEQAAKMPSTGLLEEVRAPKVVGAIEGTNAEPTVIHVR